MPVESALLLTALAIVGWSMWIRRHTWTCKWELAANRCMIYQAVGLICTAPGLLALNEWGHTLTGRWNIADFVGHTCFIAAAVATVNHALTRMHDRARFMRRIVIIVTISFLARLFFFSISQCSRHYTENYWAMPEGFNTRIYWLITAATVIYLLAYMSRLMLVLRTDPKHARTVNVYLFGALVGIATSFAKVLDAISTEQALQMPTQIWFGCCLGVAGFAIGYAYSWQLRTSDLARRWALQG